MKITREDFKDSFQTLLIFQDDNKAQEIHVYSWEADKIEQALKSMSWESITALKDYKGKKVIKKE